MKKVIAILVIAALTVAATLAGCEDLFGPTARRPVGVGVYENPPKVYTDANDAPAGLFIDLIKAIAKTEGWRLHFVRCEWNDCLRRLEAGEIDLMPDVAFSAERSRHFDFHRVSVANSWSQVHAHPDRIIETPDDLADARIAMLRGGIQQKFVEQIMHAGNIPYLPMLFDTLGEAYQAVVDGSADVVVTNSFFAAHGGRRYGLVETPIVFQPASLYFATTKGHNADLLAGIDRNLRAWRGDASSAYFEALYRAMASPPEVLVPQWARWLLMSLGVLLSMLFGLSVLLRRKVDRRTQALLATTRELEKQRENLEHLVAERTVELLAAKEEAERLSHIKSDFLANMSHEIRTPMNAILGMLYLALKNDPTPSLRNHLSKAQGAAHSLLGVINDILDISKIEAGKLELENTEFNLEPTLRQLSDAMALQAGQKGIEFLIRYDPTIPSRLIGDPLRFGQILLNLCGNAVKFTDTGEVELAFARQPEDEGKDEVVIQVTVRDTGIGIPAETQLLLFEKFSQADQSTTRRFGGTGLGLAISRNLVERMGGRLWIEHSAPQQGTTMCFSVRFGLAARDECTADVPVEQRGPMLTGVRVLVADDNEVSREILAEMLRHLGIDVGLAENAQAAFDALRSAGDRPYDLVLLDWRMPGMNGDEAARRIRNDPMLEKHPKVVMVTAYGREEVIRLSEQAGVCAFLIKPVSPSTLLDTVLSALDPARFTHERGQTPSIPLLPSAARLTGAHVLLVEDNHINREFATELLSSEGITVDLAENGAEAIERIQAFDYDAVLMDIQMPVMDGLEATRHIRALGETAGGDRFKTLPIIAMTALAMKSDAELCRAAGMNDILTKPIACERLFALLDEWVKLPETGRNPAERPADSIPPVPDDLAALHSIDARSGLRRIGGKPETFRRQLIRFREHHRRDFDTLRTLIEDAQLDEASRLCHSLKGITGNLAANELYGALDTLDEQLRTQEAPSPLQLDRTAQLWEQIIAEIDTLAAAAPTLLPERAAPTPSIVSLLERISHALEYDIGAIDTPLAQLQAATDNTDLGKEVQKLRARIEVFDIDGAAALIQRIVTDQVEVQK